MSEEELKLTRRDRIMLYNQYLILEALYPDDAESFKQKRRIAEMGYEQHYWELNSTIMECELAAETSREVMDVLDMYRFLVMSYRKLDDKEDIDEKDVRFPGFDGNSGSGRLGYVRFLILAQGGWEELIEGRQGFDLNSHMSTIGMYRRMLNAWIPLRREFPLTAEQIRQILAEKIHPEHR